MLDLWVLKSLLVRQQWPLLTLRRSNATKVGHLHRMSRTVPVELRPGDHLLQFRRPRQDLGKIMSQRSYLYRRYRRCKFQQQYPLLSENISDPSLYEDSWLTHQEIAISQLVNTLFQTSQGARIPPDIQQISTNFLENTKIRLFLCSTSAYKLRCCTALSAYRRMFFCPRFSIMDGPRQERTILQLLAGYI